MLLACESHNVFELGQGHGLILQQKKVACRDA
jgi:hypothetical protein